MTPVENVIGLAEIGIMTSFATVAWVVVRDLWRAVRERKGL